MTSLAFASFASCGGWGGILGRDLSVPGPGTYVQGSTQRYRYIMVQTEASTQLK